MALNTCNTNCNTRYAVGLFGQCEASFRDFTPKYLVAVVCQDVLSTTVFDNADGGSGDIAFLTLLNSSLAPNSLTVGASVFPIKDWEVGEPEVEERIYVACDKPVKIKHSQPITFTVNQAINIADTNALAGIIASSAIGWHQIGEQRDIENANYARLEAQKHAYFLVGCDGTLYYLGRDAGETPHTMLADVVLTPNKDNTRNQYMETAITLNSSVWITNPAYWTPRAFLTPATLAGLTNITSIMRF